MVRLLQTVLGVRDMDRAVAFWSGLLDLTPAPGHASPRFTRLESPDDTYRVALHLSTAEVQEFPRVHLDIGAADAAEAEAVVARVERLGGSRVEWPLYPSDPDFVVLADTEGNRFCVIDESHTPGS